MGVSGHAAVKALLRLVCYMAFGLALIHGLVVAVHWWQGDPLAVWEYGLLAIWPVLLYFFITRYSFFKKGCTACHKE